uniref:hypothetical protein n=1 Tax=uncultured Sphingomonas sp. TaxID=158754 RepID=UPI0025CF27BB|nr:hypothetical protein [uncultured Sphingomonas sp.]
MRDALIWAGESDPAETMAEARASDPKLEELTEVLRHWKALVGQDNEVTVRVLIDKATTQWTDPNGALAFRHPDFREALLRIAGKGGHQRHASGQMARREQGQGRVHPTRNDQ